MSLRSKLEYKSRPHPGIKAFFRIGKLWQLSSEEQATLLGIAKSTLFKWKNDSSVNLSGDTTERLSYILGIYKALQILLPDEKAADRWIKRPNKSFGGQTALSRMLSGKVADLYAVRQYLDAQRGGW